MDHKSFVEGLKTLIIAPAGYGKTHTIAECLKYTSGKQLILTHTHAGVASIKEKIKKEKAPSNTYVVETISSFSQKYVHSFYSGSEIPNQDDPKYHKFVEQQAKDIFKFKIIKKVVKATYTGLFVDEYQDCSKAQHQMVVDLSEILPTHILGDPLQGIFEGLNGEAVDFSNDLTEFHCFPELSIPHRWYQEGNNRALGDIIKNMREALKTNKPIKLVADDDNGFHVISVQPGDINDSNSKYRKILDTIIRNPKNRPYFESVLLIVPEYEEIRGGVKVLKGRISDRVSLRARIDYTKSVRLLEAIDDKAFYSLSKKADELIAKTKRAHPSYKPVKNIKNILELLFSKTDIDIWFNNEGVKRKREAVNKEKSDVLQNKITEFINFPSFQNFLRIILNVKNTLKLKYKRDDMLISFVKCLKQAEVDSVSIYEAMKMYKNTIRRVGRKVQGKCIGTTRLTKGLEFDTVAILDAHKFDCPKHLYVALSRCSKKLIIFTESKTLQPYLEA